MKTSVSKAAYWYAMTLICGNMHATAVIHVFTLICLATLSIASMIHLMRYGPDTLLAAREV